MSEMNICWHLLPLSQRLHERTIGWWETLHLSHSYNRHANSSSAYQKGGVAVLSINSAAHRVVTSGQDSTGLGRWTWTKYRGQHNVILRVVSAYRPVLNKTGALGVYNQHRRLLYDNDDDRCPRLAMIEDLCAEVLRWMEEGDQILLGMDINDNVTLQSVRQPFRDIGLEEVITHRHQGPVPSTYNRGLAPIDGIFASSTLQDVSCGYLAFGDGVPSDHRCLWIDIPYSIAFGHDIPPCVKPSARRLKCTDPRTVKQYLDYYEAFVKQHHLAERAFSLQTRAAYPLAAAEADEWESIDTLRIQGMLQAEKQCRKLRQGTIAWSPELQQSINTVTAWQLVCRSLRGVKVNSKFLHRSCAQAGIPAAPRSTLTDAQTALSQAYVEYKRVKKGSDTLRQTWLEGLASALAQSGNSSAATHYTNLLQREKQRRDARQIRRATGKLRTGGLLSVLAPTSDGTWAEMTSPHDIVDACMQENARRFRQANNTPFMTPPLSDTIGHLGIGVEADKILRGEFVPPPGTDLYAAKLIRHLRMDARVAQAPPMSTIITTDDHCEGWHHVQERTSSGPTGVHFGHFKAGTTRPLVADFDATMANIPFATGYSPTRWRHGTDVELVKKAGNFKVTDLRTIILYDAEFNRNNAILGRRLMAQAEKYSQLAPEQYGSRKRLSAIEHGLNKRLTFDLIRQLRIPAALCSNDAKSCYDRIVHSVATLSMRRLGIPEAPILSMFSTIQNMKHYVRTSYGDSDQWFGGTEWTIPVHGVGQGNGAGPAIWAAVSTPVLNLMRDEGFGTDFSAAISKESIQFVGYAFVDDTDLCETARADDTSAENVTKRMQAALNTWEGGIRATGGAIVPGKSHWYLIDFDWKNGAWKYAPMDRSPAQLCVQDAQGITAPLERLPTYEARRTLGVRLAPDGNNKAEHAYLRAQSQAWGDQVRSGHLPRHLAWQALTSTLLPKLRYPLPATTFSKRACNHILAPALQAGLPASGIVRTIPRDLVHAPLSARGLNLPDLYTEQGISYVEQLLSHGHHQSNITGKLIRGCIQQMKVEIGLPGALFCQDYGKYHQLATDTWVKHAWQFLWEHSMSINDGDPHLQLRREGDMFLVSAFSAAGFAKQCLVRLNRCRLFLQVTTLADIVTGLGTAITNSAWQGTLDTTRPKFYLWPKQQRPPQTDWFEWRAALQTTFGVHPHSRVLSRPLGAWIDDCPEWIWFLSNTDERLYRHQDQQWYFHARLPGRVSRAAITRYALGAHSILASNLPADLVRVTVVIGSTYMSCTGGARQMTKPPLATDTTFNHYIKHLPHDVQWALQSTSDLRDGAGIAEAIAAGRCFGVSDGSYKEGFGTAAWVLVDCDNTATQVKGECIVPGGPSDQSSFRSEVTGLYALCQMVWCLCKYYSIDHGHMTIGCDGKEALYRVFDPAFEPSPRDAHFDLLTASRSAIVSTTIDWSHRWVKGHQDDDPTGELDIWARLNIAMDLSAKYHWKKKTRYSRASPVSRARRALAIMD